MDAEQLGGTMVGQLADLFNETALGRKIGAGKVRDYAGPRQRGCSPNVY
jgi:hypothetical protein